MAHDKKLRVRMKPTAPYLKGFTKTDREKTENKSYVLPKEKKSNVLKYVFLLIQFDNFTKFYTHIPILKVILLNTLY